MIIEWGSGYHSLGPVFYLGVVGVALDGVLPFFFLFFWGNCMDIESKNERSEGMGERVLSVFWSSGLLLTR